MAHKWEEQTASTERAPMSGFLVSLLTRAAVIAIEMVVTRLVTRLWTEYAHSRDAANPAFA
ncbi:hypothetical protein KQY30_20590 [Streptomyces sp. GMY02]|uniref:hypothetical protein n=1 Tax=Streptomyces sp. GMY02 TaxID=1333528 RepID=UPI001C2C2E72|nr:hypothetical protein [Streptomyces sp. GMY02]QXE36282.1 hypothetical protein KQY30_20590 [Streptomyces sp. GMY02]